MYFGALIQLPDGTRKIVEKGGWGTIGAFKFLAAIGEYAKKENKLVKVCCDDFKVLEVLRKSLPDVKVEYGVEGELDLELKTNEAQ
jgi:hypothetical protein